MGVANVNFCLYRELCSKKLNLYRSVPLQLRCMYLFLCKLNSYSCSDFPSLRESTIQLFAKAGFKISKSARSYRPSFDDAELDGRFVRAQEVSRYVGMAISIVVLPVRIG